MDKNTLLRWAIIAIGVLLFWKWGMPALTGKSGHNSQPIREEAYINAPDFMGDAIDPPQDGTTPNKPPVGELCTIKGNRFEATLSSRGAGITHYKLTDPQYRDSEAADLSTTPDMERWRSLRTLFRTEPGKAGDASEQVKYDRFNWEVEKLAAGNNEAGGCRFTYADDSVKIVKTVMAGARPFELEVETALTNLADAPKRHRFAIQNFSFRRNKEVKGNLGRVSPFMTDLECANGSKVERKAKDDFKEGWYTQPADRYVAISNTYFAQALVVDTPGTCEILAEDWFSAGQSRDDDEAGAVYHANLTYPSRELAHGATATYRTVALGGPKERDVLAHAAGGHKGLGDLINLGFFSVVAKVLVDILLFFRNKVTGNWGLAIIVMTLCLRMLLFPLTWKSIKSSLAMRRLKPEVDALNERFAGDPQAKNMAMMELWKKNGVNPFGGCLPQLVQMPIWFAMYTTLQTAVEMYHTKFLWFTDLSAPDKFYVLPIVLGVFMIVQQRIVPQQGMDPVQQKMMTYLLPGVFTVMMLFLPAALGVYMLTNSVLGIAQQLAIEQLAPKSAGTPKGKNDIEVREASGGTGSNLRKGKARV
ncbi:membrane protein insertase YidC [Pendulispora albinea]|uniref:Membrane protein insertase YidC n=1 Tax=Pendulispora albinea TaxID=2741071 RepID=A0ABZ2M4Z9_9BACT